MTNRTVLAVTGEDRVGFLQGLVTNDVSKADGGIAYAALLTPQGKYLADFFLIGQPARILIDVCTSHAAALLQRLSMYKLRAEVEISETDIIVSLGISNKPAEALDDPRGSALGWRLYGNLDQNEAVDWETIRVDLLIPETGAELTPDTFILEAGFERLNGVDFRKGCYVGQEVTARMKHKTELRKGLAKVQLIGDAKAGDAIMSGEKVVGTLNTVAGGRAIAYLRFDRATGEMTAGNATVQLLA